MKSDVLLVSAPVMSVVRPSAALGLLQATLKREGISVQSLYLNLLFAETIGIDLNERLAGGLPSHLLAGDWIFAGCLPRPPAALSTEHEAQLNSFLLRRDFDDLSEIQSVKAAEFVAIAAAEILQRKPRIVGFTTMFEQTAASLAIAAAVKKAAPKIIICFGGANCHGSMGSVLLKYYSQIDYVFTGESDSVFAPFVARILAGRAPQPTQGWLGRNGKGNFLAQPVIALDALPIPDYSDYFVQLKQMSEASRVRSCVPFESSRGCWWGQKNHCTFCGLNAEGMVFRDKSSNRVLAELEALAQAHGIYRFAACDNILSMKHIDGVLEQLAVPKKNWKLFYEVKSNMDEARLRILAEAGVVWIQPGIESLSNSTLKLMRKGVDCMLNLRLLRNCRELGMSVIWSMLYGFPGEDVGEYKEMAQLLPQLEHLQPPVGCGRIRLDRFSPNFQQADSMGFTSVRPTGAYGAIYDVPTEALADLAYFFEGYAPTAAHEEDLLELKSAIATWRSHWEPGSEPPNLLGMQVGDRCLIKDTRSCAVDFFYLASVLETSIIDICRSARAPGSLDVLLERWSASAIEEGLAALLFRNFILLHDGHFLSLVVVAGREMFTDEDRDDLALGYIEPASAAVEAVAI